MLGRGVSIDNKVMVAPKWGRITDSHLRDKEWQLCTTPVFKKFGGKGRAINGRNIYFLFSYFFSKREWHLCCMETDIYTLTCLASPFLSIVQLVIFQSKKMGYKWVEDEQHYSPTLAP